MAKKANVEEERNVKVQAKVNLKYDSDVVKTGEELLIRQSDIESMKLYIDVIDIPNDTTDSTNAGQQTPPPAK